MILAKHAWKEVAYQTKMRADASNAISAHQIAPTTLLTGSMLMDSIVPPMSTTIFATNSIAKIFKEPTGKLQEKRVVVVVAER